MRSLRWLSLFVAFAIILAVITPIFVDRSEHARAVASYAKNPSPENERALHRQQQITQKIQEREALLIFSSLLAAMISANGCIGRASGRVRAAASPSESPNGPMSSNHLTRPCHLLR